MDQQHDDATLPTRLRETLGASYGFERKLGGGVYAVALDSLRPVAADVGETNSLYLGLPGRLDAQLAALGNRLAGANTLERAFMASMLGHKAEAVALLQEAFAQGLGFAIRWRLHWFTDTKPLRGYPPFEKMLEPQG